MEYEDLVKMSYTMQEEYQRYSNMGGATHAVAEKYPEADSQTIRAMWLAIDAYVDLNT